MPSRHGQSANVLRWAAGACLGAALTCSGGGVRLGAVLPLSGADSAYGASLREGVELAVQRINREGGVEGRRLSLTVRDSASNPRLAAQAFQSLVTEDHVSAVIGGCTSGEALAMGPLAQRDQRVLLSPSATDPDQALGGGWLFRIWPTDEAEGKALAEFAAFSLHATRVLRVLEANPYAEGVSRAFAARFGSSDRLSNELRLASGTGPAEAAALVAKAVGDAQAIFVVGNGAGLFPLLGALEAQGLNRPLLSVSALSDAGLLERFGGQTEGVIFARPAFEPASGDPATQEFVEAFKALHGREPDIYAAHGYDAVGILVSVMAAGGTDAASIRRGLLALRTYRGAAGPTTFDAHGGAVQPYQLCVVRKGRVVPLKDVLETVLVPLQLDVERLRFGR